MNLFWCKTNVESWGFNNLHQDFDIMRMLVEITGANKMYNKKYINVHLAFLI